MKIRNLIILWLCSLSVYASFPTEGTIRSVVILVEFSDVQFIIPSPNEAFTRLLNEPGYSENGGTGSARDYFIENSYGAFTPTFDVYGPYRLEKTEAYYGGNGSQGSDVNPEQMIIDACNAAANAGVDFSLYDMDNDGMIDNVFVYYAGYNEAEGGGAGTIWPHRYVIKSRPSYNGKQLYDYACTSELRTSSGRKDGKMCGIGTFCHEFSHVLGLPDLYNTKNSEAYTVGNWDVMCSGNYNNEGRTPPAYSGFERFMMGWLVPEQLQQAGDYLLDPLEAKKESFLLCPVTHSLNPSSLIPEEFWMVENRQHTDWDTPTEALPGEGLLISHITYDAAGWIHNTFNNQLPLGYDICEAYNVNPTRSSSSDTYPGVMGIDEFIPVQNNGKRLYELELYSIRQNEDGSVSFHFGEESEYGFHFHPRELPTLHTAVNGTKREYEVGKLQVTGKGIGDSIVYMVGTPNWFELSLDSANWHGDTIWFMQPLTDSTFSQVVYIRYKGIQTCQTKNGLLRISTANQQQRSQTVLSGYAARPIMIHPVEGQPATEVTPYAFQANWTAQADAEYYYLTAYHLADGESESKQGFDTFDSQEHIESAQWHSNFVNLSTAEHVEGSYALLFTKTGDYIESELYPVGVSKLSFWLSHTYSGTDMNIGGELVLTAKSGDMWQPIDTIRMRAMSRAQTKEYSFSEEQDFRQFRLTYLHYDGQGGITLDRWIATLPKTVEYLLQGYETVNNSLLIDSLLPSNNYYYQLGCYENKGCEPHSTTLGDPVHVLTKVGTTEDNQLTVLKGGDYAIAYFREAVESDSYLIVYSPSGNLEMSLPVPRGATKVIIPTGQLSSGNIYLVKLSSDGSLRRKEHWAKFLN